MVGVDASPLSANLNFHRTVSFTTRVSISQSAAPPWYPCPPEDAIVFEVEGLRQVGGDPGVDSGLAQTHSRNADWRAPRLGPDSIRKKVGEAAVLEAARHIKLETLCTREAGRHAPFLRDKYLAMHVKAPSIRFGRQLSPNRTITQKANQGAQRRKRRDDAGRAPLAMAPLRLPSPFILSIGRCWLASTLVASSG